jgi:hypothetical protein
VNDIVSEGTKDNETWIECPICHRTWRAVRPIPGLLHQFKTCPRCQGKKDNEEVSH